MRWIIRILVIFAVTPIGLAQVGERRNTVWDGVFTEGRGSRGKDAYMVTCSSFHSDDLEGLAGPTLKGPQFIDNWREDRVKSLFSFIQTQMPARARGSLNTETYLDILAYILSVNMFPAGSKELT